MFFSTDILSHKGGKFGLVWIFASFNNETGRPKFSKREIIDLNLPALCQDIMHPKEPLALRLSSNLLVGVARIYNKQQIIFWAETGAIWSQVQKKTREHTNENLLTLQNDLAREDNITLHPLNTTDRNMLRHLLEEINLDDVATDQHFTTSQLFSSTANTTTMPTPTTHVPDAPLSDAYYTGSNSNAHITSARDEEINLNTQDHHNLDMEANLDLDVTMGQLDLSLDPELDFSDPTDPSGQSEPMDMGVDFEMQIDHHDVAAPVHVPDDIEHAETQETTMGLAQMDSMATSDTARTSEKYISRAPRARKNKRNKRNSIIMDTNTTIDGQTMRQNLADASDLVAWPKKAGFVPTALWFYKNPANLLCFISPDLLELFTVNTRPTPVDQDGRKPEWWDEVDEKDENYQRSSQDGTAGDTSAQRSDPLHMLDEDINPNVPGIELESEASDLEEHRMMESSTNISDPAFPGLDLSMEVDGSDMLTSTPKVFSLKRDMRMRRGTSSGSGSDSSMPRKAPKLGTRRGSNDAESSDGGAGEGFIGDSSGAASRDPGTAALSQALATDTQHFYRHVNKFAGPSENVTFKTMVPTKAPKSMASKAFYQMLVLANMGAVELHQNDPYSDINIRITHEMV